MMIFCYLTPRVHSQLWFNCIFNDLFMNSPSAVIAQIGLRTLDCIKAIELSFGIRKELNTFFFFIVYPKLTALKALKFANYFHDNPRKHSGKHSLIWLEWLYFQSFFSHNVFVSF